MNGGDAAAAHAALSAHAFPSARVAAQGASPEAAAVREVEDEVAARLALSASARARIAARRPAIAAVERERRVAGLARWRAAGRA